MKRRLRNPTLSRYPVRHSLCQNSIEYQQRIVRLVYLAGRKGVTIAELSKEFGLTLRALRFYDSRGLIAPVRAGRRRVFSRADRDRLALIVKGKKLGFTLTEISQMIEAQSGRANAHSLKLSAEKCLEQIAFFERQMREAAEALTELREIHLSLSKQAMERGARG